MLHMSQTEVYAGRLDVNMDSQVFNPTEPAPTLASTTTPGNVLPIEPAFQSLAISGGMCSNASVQVFSREVGDRPSWLRVARALCVRALALAGGASSSALRWGSVCVGVNELHGA